MSDATTARILCVDDEPRVLDGMKRTLGMDFDVITAEGGAQALALLIRKERFALTISDIEPARSIRTIVRWPSRETSASSPVS